MLRIVACIGRRYAPDVPKSNFVVDGCAVGVVVGDPEPANDAGAVPPTEDAGVGAGLVSISNWNAVSTTWPMYSFVLSVKAALSSGVK